MLVVLYDMLVLSFSDTADSLSFCCKGLSSLL